MITESRSKEEEMNEKNVKTEYVRKVSGKDASNQESKEPWKKGKGKKKDQEERNTKERRIGDPREQITEEIKMERDITKEVINTLEKEIWERIIRKEGDVAES